MKIVAREDGNVVNGSKMRPLSSAECTATAAEAAVADAMPALGAATGTAAEGFEKDVEEVPVAAAGMLAAVGAEGVVGGGGVDERVQREGGEGGTAAFVAVVADVYRAASPLLRVSG